MSNPRIPRKSGQPANSKKHSDLYTDENPKGTIHGLGFKDVATAKASVSKIRNSSRSHAHKIQAAVAMEQRAREMGKSSEAAVYRKFINSMKKKTKKMNEGYNADNFNKLKEKIGSAKKHRKPAVDEANDFSQRDKIMKKAKPLHKHLYKNLHKKDTTGDVNEEKKNGRCPAGSYYCYTDEKCKPIPRGFMVDPKGMLRKENGHSVDENGKKKKNGSVSNGNGNGNGGNGNGSGNGGSSSGISEEGLRDWFGKSKSKDGKKGWVQVVSGKPCARQPGQKSTPKCVSSAKRASMTDAERKSAQRRKRAADPGQPQKSGAAKPTYVSTDKPKKMKESAEIQTEGKKDACYHKVKSRYSVWPSAYASGALVKCRKVGAANWGNKSKTKKEEFEMSDWRSELDEKCWKGYEKKGMKTMFGKRYPNCVKKTKKEEVEYVDENVSSGRSRIAKSGRVQGKPVGAITNAEYSAKLKKQKDEGKAKDKSVADKVDVSGMSPFDAAMAKKRAEFKAEKARLRAQKKTKKEELQLISKTPLDEKMGCMHTHKGEECPVHGKKECPEIVAAKMDEAVRVPAKTGNIVNAYFKFRSNYISLKMFFPQTSVPNKADVQSQVEKVYPGARLLSFQISDYEPGEPVLHTEDWQKKSGKNPEGGLNEKGRKSYERQNPGSDLKRPSKKVGNKRRASFCARMKGMKKKLTSSKTANDPDSRINKSLRAWNC